MPQALPINPPSLAQQCPGVATPCSHWFLSDTACLWQCVQTEALGPYLEGPGGTKEETAKTVTLLLEVSDFESFRDMMLFTKKERDNAKEAPSKPADIANDGRGMMDVEGLMDHVAALSSSAKSDEGWDQSKWHLHATQSGDEERLAQHPKEEGGRERQGAQGSDLHEGQHHLQPHIRRVGGCFLLLRGEARAVGFELQGSFPSKGGGLYRR
mmetsp:Transcript_24452/g.61680  ORF Transcript_24452/g.61680 Transcript_24452/m.61680 type:complete len:212 (+) Transcript_24452:438-1073(+)